MNRLRTILAEESLIAAPRARQQAEAEVLEVRGDKVRVDIRGRSSEAQVPASLAGKIRPGMRVILKKDLIRGGGWQVSMALPSAS